MRANVYVDAFNLYYGCLNDSDLKVPIELAHVELGGCCSVSDSSVTG